MRSLALLAMVAVATGQDCKDFKCRPVDKTTGEEYDWTHTPVPGDCLADDSFDAMKQRVGLGLAERTKLDKLGRVVIDIGGWLSVDLMGWIAAIILKETMNINATIRQSSQDLVGAMICCEPYIGMELWGWDRKTLKWQGNLSSLYSSNVGYEGTSSFFVSQEFMDQYPLADTWSAYRYLPEYYDALPNAGSFGCEKKLSDPTLPCEPGNYVCDSAKAWPRSECHDGYYKPQACNGVDCKEFIMRSPDWDDAWFESLIEKRGLKVQLGYYGKNHAKLVLDLVANKTFNIFYWYMPDPLLVLSKAVTVNFPRTNLGCLSGFVNEPLDSTVDCAFPLQNLKKFTSKSLLSQSADLQYFFDSFRMSSSHIDGAMATHVNGGGPLETQYDAACKWVRENAPFWEPWIANNERKPAAPNATTIVTGGGGMDPAVIGGVIGGVVFIFAIILGVILFKRWKDGEKMRFLLDNNRIAEESCDAIAEMRLEDMEWLKEIESPNRIQKSFLRIIDTLVEYRRFLPAHLRDNGEEDAESENQSEKSSQAGIGSKLNSLARKASVVQSKASGGASSKASSIAASQLKKQKTAAKFVLGLTQKKGTACVVNLAILSDQTGGLMTEMLEMVENAVGKSRTFSQIALLGQLAMTWNTSIPSAGHHDAAIDVIGNYVDMMKKARNEGKSNMVASVGVSTGQQYSGNLGTANARHYVVLGSPMQRAAVLSKLAADVQVECAADNGFVVPKANSIKARIIDLVHWQGGKNKEFIWQYIEKVNAANDEWMYQLEEIEKAKANDPLEHSNAAWRALSDPAERSKIGDLMKNAAKSLTDAGLNVVLARLEDSAKDVDPVQLGLELAPNRGRHASILQNV